MKIYAGTSGWSYENWHPGFYPGFAKAADRLEVYGTKLPAVELNSSFYSLPAPVVIRKWLSSVPPDFRFAVKAWQRITHEKMLAGCAEELAAIRMVAETFGEQLGPILFQLPPFLEADEKLLEDFIIQLGAGAKYTFEFRHRSWFSEKTIRAQRAKASALSAISHAARELH